MEIGSKLKEARLALGLSQKQLCGEKITRNMLSLIENGTAAPSMDTLRYLAKRLGKPVAYFLDEAVSVNQQVMLQARQQSGLQALETLKGYLLPDPVFDPEYYLLTALSALDAAQQALEDGRIAYCRELLKQAETAGANTPYYTPALKRRQVLLAFLADPENAQALEKELPQDEGNLLLARASLGRGLPEECLSRLLYQSGELAEKLRAEAYFAKKDYKNALECFKKLPDHKQDLSAMEVCCRELGDFEQAYFYACRQR